MRPLSPRAHALAAGGILAWAAALHYNVSAVRGSDDYKRWAERTEGGVDAGGDSAVTDGADSDEGNEAREAGTDGGR